jgi:hypothetical protein
MQHVIFEGVRSGSLYFKIVLTRAAVTYQHALGFDLKCEVCCSDPVAVVCRVGIPLPCFGSE